MSRGSRGTLVLPSPTPPGGLVEDRFPELGTKKAKRRKKKSSLISKEDLLKEMELNIDDVGDDNLSAWQQGQQRTLRNAHAALHSPIGTKHSAQLRREEAVRTELKRLRPHVRAHHRSGHRGKVRESPATPARASAASVAATPATARSNAWLFAVAPTVTPARWKSTAAAAG